MKMPGMTFSKDALVAFLLNHVEKIVVAVIGVVALALAWNGVSALRLKLAPADRQPQAIIDLANQTTQHIDAEPNPPAEVMRRVGELAKVIDPWRGPKVMLAAPPDLAPLSRPIVATFTLRGEPQVFPIEDLRVVVGVAVVKDQAVEQAATAFATQAAADASDAATGAESGNPDYEEPVKRFEKLVPCVVLVGLVPVARQRTEFRSALGTQADDTAPGQQVVDMPRWGDVVVERALAADADDPDAWSSILTRLVADQGGGTQLPDRFLLRPEDLARADEGSGYVTSLPPRLFQPWGLDTIHPWFLQPRHKWRLERAEQIAETPVRLGPAEFRQHFVDHAGHEVEIVGMKFAGATQRSASPDVVFVNVAAADGSETFPPPDPAAAAHPGGTAPAGTATESDHKPVFVMASEWQKKLKMKEVEQCTLRVVPSIEGSMALAQIVGITPLNKDGTRGVEQRNPRAGPEVGAVPGPGVDGAMLGGGGPDEGAEYRLFRFVDDTVEFGKAYRYRVKLEVANPNWGLEPKLLANPKSAEQELLEVETAASAPVLVPAPYVMLVRDSLDTGVSAARSADDGTTETSKPTGPKPPQLGRTQVEISFLGPTWWHMRGKRPDQGFDYFDYAIERVIPVEPGGSVLWKRSRKQKTTEKKKDEPRAAKPVPKPFASDPSWKLLTTADVGCDLLDFRGSQMPSGSPDGSRKDVGVIREPVDVALLHADGSLEVVTAADSQHVLDAIGYQRGAGEMSTPSGSNVSPPEGGGPRRPARIVP